MTTLLLVLIVIVSMTAAMMAHYVLYFSDDKRLFFLIPIVLVPGLVMLFSPDYYRESSAIEFFLKLITGCAVSMNGQFNRFNSLPLIHSVVLGIVGVFIVARDITDFYTPVFLIIAVATVLSNLFQIAYFLQNKERR